MWEACKLVLTVSNKSFFKKQIKQLVYRNYKKFSSSSIFTINVVQSCRGFDQIFLNILEKHAALKRKLLRANHSTYIPNPPLKAIMRRSYLEKDYFKSNSEKSFNPNKAGLFEGSLFLGGVNLTPRLAEDENLYTVTQSKTS